MKPDVSRVVDRAHPTAGEIAAQRRKVDGCYCGLGPACPSWRQMSPAEREECSLDKRLTAQRFWKNGM
jgi:hypothetical protein